MQNDLFSGLAGNGLPFYISIDPIALQLTAPFTPQSTVVQLIKQCNQQAHQGSINWL
jgi:hypothetical protein